MKKHIYFLLAMLISASVYGQDYFWVGNGGNWSDVNHWATSSGGAEFHSELPGPDNDVYFDENSFTEPDQVVIIDLDESFCRDFTAVGVVNSPSIEGVNYNDYLDIYGDLTLSPEMDRDLKVVRMMSEGTAEITTGEISLGASTFLRISGGGDIQLMDSLSSPNLYVIEGTFHSNNHAVNIPARVYGYLGQNMAMYMGTSNVYTRLWKMNENIDLDMESATLYFGTEVNPYIEFDGGGNHYHHVIFEGEVDISYNNSFDIFEAIPGANINLEAGSVQTAEQFILNGSSDENIQLSSLEPGVQATFSQASGTVNASYLSLVDNNATGGAAFNAEVSVDLGNNSGWNISTNAPQDYFWVGESGDWTDAENWATTSGGSVFHESPPTAVDDVFFDENSFPGLGGVVSMDGVTLNCRNFTVLGISEDVTFQQYNNGTLNVYGDLLLDQNATYSFADIWMQSTVGATIDLQDAPLGSSANLKLSGAGNFDLQSDLNARSLEVEYGNFNSNGYPLLVTSEFKVAPDYTGLVNLSASYIETTNFNQSSGVSAITLTNTEIHLKSILYGDGLAINQLTFIGNAGGSATTFGSYSVNDFTVLPGVDLTIGAGNIITLDEVSLDGTAEEPITIESFSEGMATFFSKANGEVNGYHLNLTDNHGIGGATFTAHNSILGANVEGWSIPIEVSEQTKFNTKLYPNPAQGQVFIEAQPGTEWYCTDTSGRILMRGVTSNIVQVVDVTDLAAGAYLITLINSNQEPTSHRLIID
jgi:hypothetical protein